MAKCVGNFIYVLLPEGLFKIDSKTKEAVKIEDGDDAMDGEVLQFESGSDFTLTLKTSKNLYARGGN